MLATQSLFRQTPNPYLVATGPDGAAGTIDGNYKYHRFTVTKTGSAGFAVSNVGNVGEVEYLIVAGGGGGGGGGSSAPGGGGAGGYRTATGLAITLQNYDITVGTGGGGGSGDGAGSSGTASTFNSLSSAGGGGGGGYSSRAGGNGGSGGGACINGAAGTGNTPSALVHLKVMMGILEKHNQVTVQVVAVAMVQQAGPSEECLVVLVVLVV